MMLFAPCYALGEYQSVKAADDRIYVLWGDTRRTVTEPMNKWDPLSGVNHPQEGVFFEATSPE
jgi:hypothetical protein